MTEGAVKMTKCAIWDRSQGHWQGLWGLRASLKEIFPFGQDDRKYGQDDRKYGQDDRKYGQDDRKYGQDDRRWGQDDRMCDTGPIVRALAWTMGAWCQFERDLSLRSR